MTGASSLSGSSRAASPTAVAGRHGLLLWVLLVVAASCAPRAGELAPAGDDVYPDEHWTRWVEPQQGGFSSEGLEPVEERLEELPSDAMMVVSGGRVAYEYGDFRRVSYLASVRKSILAMLYGPYVQHGTIDLDRTLDDLEIDDVEGLTDSEKQAAVRHIISARSGVYHPASNPGDNLSSAPDRGSQEPGEYYLYSNWDFNVAGTIFEEETGRNIFDALETDLAEPLGFRDFDRNRHEKGGDMDRSVHPSYHMHLSTRDMARVGYLMLREGRWKDEQLISPEWVKEMTGLITPIEEMNPESRRDGRHGYGYMWWVWDGDAADGAFEGAYTGVGAWGQYITVLPEIDVVVAHKTVPGDEGRVQHDQYYAVLEDLVDAYCGSDCP